MQKHKTGQIKNTVVQHVPHKRQQNSFQSIKNEDCE